MSVPMIAAGAYRRPRQLAIAAACTAVAVTLAGCSSDGDAKDKSSPTVAPSKTTDPKATAEQKAQKAVTAAYRGYWDAQIKAYAKADPKGSGLDKYAFDRAYSKTFAELATMKGAGNVLKGQPRISPEEPEVNLDKSPQEATLKDCVDVSGWKLQKEKSGKEVPLPKKRLTRFVTKVSARTVGDKWMIINVDQTDLKC
ncbi:hypothetical protein [Streptomyces sp. MZ04]|uniref:hypothetical protein n=1 Tax=Streptomyces sp. MZ04 TaxID=2559236 RepID=UPI00107EE4F9|nr:hypothetical protein [Streptomyces sp. MZ04]TGB15510.1 hypothetical protein E2651_02505 [Streptomyces sp. MZ04]